MSTHSAYHCGLLQIKAHRVVRSHLNKALSKFDISIPEWSLLAHLRDQRGIRLSEIATLLQVEAPLVTTLVHQLERLNLVSRKDDPRDSRAKHISLTAKGRRVLPRMDEAVCEAVSHLMDGVDESNLDVYFAVLEAVVAHSNEGADAERVES
jgi:DNA-binding MarR family transcriptional regulator